MPKFICELHETCQSKHCLEKKPHEKKPWCKKASKCCEFGTVVKCVEVPE